MNASRRILGRGWSDVMGRAGGLIAQGFGVFWLAIYNEAFPMLRSCQRCFTITLSSMMKRGIEELPLG